jgi:hypothetical protein
MKSKSAKSQKAAGKTKAKVTAKKKRATAKKASPKMKTKRRFLIAAGDDWPEEYGRGFDVPIQTICDIISESLEWDLPIDWREASQQQPHGIRLLFECLESIDSSCDIYQIFDVIEGCSVTCESWGGDSPGRSGVWVEIHAEEGKLAPARIVVRELATVLRRYWQSSGNAAKADAYMATHRAEQEASAKERKDKEQQKRLEWEAEQRRKMNDWVTNQLNCLLQYLSKPKLLFYKDGRFLATSDGRIYVLTENSMRYYSYDGSEEQKVVKELRKRGYRVIEVAERYPPGTSRIPYFAGALRKFAMGWKTRKTLLTADARLSSELKPEAVRDSYLKWKLRRLKTQLIREKQRTRPNKASLERLREEIGELTNTREAASKGRK